MSGAALQGGPFMALATADGTAKSGHIVRKDLFKQKSSAFVSFSDDAADTAVHGYLGMLDGAVFDGNTLTGQLALSRCLDNSWQVFSTFAVWLFWDSSSW